MRQRRTRSEPGPWNWKRRGQQIKGGRAAGEPAEKVFSELRAKLFVKPDYIWIAAIAHASRRPGYWTGPAA